MPRSKQYKEHSRQQVLNAAYTLFSQYGYKQVTIDQIMNSAGLTRGAFYNHFSSKADVYEQAFHFGTQQQLLYKMSTASPFADIDGVKKAIEYYLSHEHLNGDLPGCPLSFLNSDCSGLIAPDT